MRRATPAFRVPRASLAAASLLLAASALFGGCTSQTDPRLLPGLADLVATGPAGRKCYEHCALYRSTCKSMCPTAVGECQRDCEIDSKHCLVDCPELKRVTPVPQ